MAELHYQAFEGFSFLLTGRSKKLYFPVSNKSTLALSHFFFKTVPVGGILQPGGGKHPPKPS
jgi:hypothetical protein